METPIKYSDSNRKTDKTISMLSPRRTGLHIIYSIALLFLKIPHTNEIFYVLSVSANYSLCVLSALSVMECNGYGFLVHVLSYRTLRFDFGSQCALETVLRRIYFLMIFYLIQSS